MATSPTTVKEYLAGLPPDQRVALERLRKQIRAAAPDATEGIGYGIVVFRLDDRGLVGIGATARHCAFYLMSSSVLKPFAREAASWKTGKGTIQFQPDNPLPATLVRKLVNARIVENG